MEMKVMVVIALLVILIGYMMYFMKDTLFLPPKKINHKPNVRLDFINFWSAFNKENNYFINLLERYNYTITIDTTNPDIIFINLPENRTKVNTNAKQIGFIGEPNFKPIKDYHLNLTFDKDKGNNIRLPLWLLYAKSEPGGGGHLVYKDDIYPDKYLQLYSSSKQKFCCWIAGNCTSHREEFVKELSKYNKVDCGGSCLNNIGYKVDDKIEFQKDYKFCIAFENTKQEGYTTEKILQAYQSNCIPIYFGNEKISEDFNPETFINSHDFENTDKLIEYIIRVDSDDKLYNSFLNKPVYSKHWIEIFNDPNETYFRYICNKIVSN
jgi:alpha(1,3/1,4) fucosyltransferase